jgi:hypothetical protein
VSFITTCGLLDWLAVEVCLVRLQVAWCGCQWLGAVVSGLVRLPVVSCANLSGWCAFKVGP